MARENADTLVENFAFSVDSVANDLITREISLKSAPFEPDPFDIDILVNCEKSERLTKRSGHILLTPIR